MLGVCYYPEHWPDRFWPRTPGACAKWASPLFASANSHGCGIEPRRGEFTWDWLDRAMNALGDAGLKIVLGTPTAAPPKWLMDEFPEIAPVDYHGRPRGFGSRRHYRFSSKVYWREIARIVEALSERYGRHPALVGWQTDNEYGCHDTVLSWGPEDLKAFRDWLRHRYQSPERLNEAWELSFWSMELQDFDAVSLPNLTVTKPNPAARLDFWRFSVSSRSRPMIACNAR